MKCKQMELDIFATFFNVTAAKQESLMRPCQV